MTKRNVRHAALDILLRIEKEGSFSHLLLSQTIKKEQISHKDESLLMEIVYGTLERKLTLDYYLQPYIQSQKRLADWVRILLRMSVFQTQFLDHVPEYAVIHEAVEIAKKKGHRGISSFVNGVLRNMQRKGVPSVEAISDPISRLSIETSHPEWLVRRWVEHYGMKITREMCETNIEKKPISIRVNRLRTDQQTVLAQLKQDGIDAIPSPFVKDGIIIKKGNILKTKLVQEGFVTIQDQSSMLASTMLAVEPQMDVLDACSAPGGKATYIAEMMDNKGVVHAYDLHKNKTKLITDNAKRLGLTNIKVGQSDARNLQALHDNESFDRILIDAPCSGLGVIRSKPDIKYNKQVEDIQKLHDVQLAILNHVAPLLKTNGKLVYSTCTVDIIENEAVVKEFLSNHPNYVVDELFLKELNIPLYEEARKTAYGLQLFPQTMESDGFFITRLCKIFR